MARRPGHRDDGPGARDHRVPDQRRPDQVPAPQVPDQQVPAQRRAEPDRLAEDAGSDGPTELSGRSWWQVLKRTAKGVSQDNLTDWAAALTYYSVLSIFPGLVLLTALIGMMGPAATQTLIDNIGGVAPAQAGDILINAIREVQRPQGLAGPLAIAGLGLALWSASSYIAAFMRASNAIYQMPEGRPIWKLWPLRLGMTLAVVVLLALSVAGVVLSGGVAARIGELLGVGARAVQVWDIVKWPVIALLISLAIALLYWAAPNVRHPAFRWLSPGGVLAVLLWVLASLGFAFYVTNFGSYNKTYGSLAGVIVFLVWLWISNIAVLLGAELDAELARGKQIDAGQREDEEPFLPPRDTRKAPEVAQPDR